MKTYIKYFAGVLFAIGFLSCDKIDAPYRESSGGVTGRNDTVIISGDTIFFPLDLTTPAKKVLVEDYTGHTCGKCPFAGVYLNDTLKQIYGDKLVVISVHGGYFAEPCPPHTLPPGAPAGSFALDLRCQTSQDWYTTFAVSSNPNGMIDRIDYPASQLKTPDGWSAPLQAESVLAPEMKIRIINHYNAATRELKTGVYSKFLGNKTGTYKLTVVLIEDGIIDWQLWDSPHAIEFDPAYLNHGVLRGGINGSFGSVIATGSITNGTVNLIGYSYVLDNAWIASNCKVVAFVYDETNYKVLQVEEADVE